MPGRRLNRSGNPAFLPYLVDLVRRLVGRKLAISLPAWRGRVHSGWIRIVISTNLDLEVVAFSFSERPQLLINLFADAQNLFFTLNFPVR